MDYENYDTTIISDIKVLANDTVTYVYWRSGLRYEKTVQLNSVDQNYKTIVYGLFDKIYTSLSKGHVPSITCYTNRQGQPTRFNLYLSDGFHSITTGQLAEMTILHAMFRQ
jgi:hypothetical protein